MWWLKEGYYPHFIDGAAEIGNCYSQDFQQVMPTLSEPEVESMVFVF